MPSWPGLALTVLLVSGVDSLSGDPPDVEVTAVVCVVGWVDGGC